jgi:hypothetical protein
MERDSEAPRNGYTAWSYIEALKAGLLPVCELGLFFQQDNAKIHVANGLRGSSRTMEYG